MLHVSYFLRSCCFFLCLFVVCIKTGRSGFGGACVSDWISCSFLATELLVWIIALIAGCLT